jgi:hypothetical protein
MLWRDVNTPQYQLKLEVSFRWALILLFTTCLIFGGSSVRILVVSDYGLVDRATEVRSPAKEKDFSSSVCIQTSSGAHPAFCPMGTRGPFPRGKVWPGRDADHSPQLVPRSWMTRSYTSSPPPAPKWCVVGLAFYLPAEHLLKLPHHSCQTAHTEMLQIKIVYLTNNFTILCFIWWYVIKTSDERLT